MFLLILSVLVKNKILRMYIYVQQILKRLSQNKHNCILSNDRCHKYYLKKWMTIFVIIQKSSALISVVKGPHLGEYTIIISFLKIKNTRTLFIDESIVSCNQTKLSYNCTWHTSFYEGILRLYTPIDTLLSIKSWVVYTDKIICWTMNFESQETIKSLRFV